MREQRATFGPFDLAYKQWGPADQEPVIALHGWLDNAATFDALAPLMPQKHLYALDFPGHGHSGHLGFGSYHYVDWLAPVLSFIESLPFPQVSLMGHSMGAGIAALFASLFPQKVRKLSLIEGLAPLTTEAQEMPERVRVYLNRFLSLGDKSMPVHPSLEACARARQKVGRISYQGALRLVQRGTEQVQGGYTWKSDRLLTLPSPMRFTKAQVEAFLKGIECPVQLIVAEDGFLPSRKYFEDLTQCISHLHLCQVEGGHHVHLDSPELVAPLVDRFLS